MSISTLSISNQVPETFDKEGFEKLEFIVIGGGPSFGDVDEVFYFSPRMVHECNLTKKESPKQFGQRVLANKNKKVRK